VTAKEKENGSAQIEIETEAKESLTGTEITSENVTEIGVIETENITAVVSIGRGNVNVSIVTKQSEDLPCKNSKLMPSTGKYLFCITSIQHGLLSDLTQQSNFL